jgi:hypothetical protein
MQHDFIELAARHSSLAAAREYETHNPPMHIGNPANWVPGYRFVRSGHIGQWKQYFTEQQVETIRDTLQSLGVSFSDFVTEPRRVHCESRVVDQINGGERTGL